MYFTIDFYLLVGTHNHIKSTVVPQLTHYNFCFLFQCDGKRVIMEDFKSSIEIKGHDVLNGLREISQKSKENILKKLLP